MTLRLAALSLLAACVILAGCTSRGHAQMPEQTAFVPGTPRPSASASWHALGEAYLVAARPSKDGLLRSVRPGADLPTMT